MSDYKEIWVVLTLVDITETGDTKGSGKARNQQRNFETLQQTIGMLTQPWSLNSPKVLKLKNVQNVYKKVTGAKTIFGPKHIFTEEIFENLNVWLWNFGVEAAEVFGKDGEKLIEALNMIPVINNLDEQCDLNPPIFSTSDKDRNIIAFRT